MNAHHSSARTFRILTLLILLFVSPASLDAQEFHCGTRPSETVETSHRPPLLKGIEPHGGAYLPFEGFIRGLVVYVQTANDGTEDERWARGTLPEWSDTFVRRLEQYYADMSHGRLQMELNVHPQLMVTKSTEDGYLYWGQRFGDAIKEILKSLDTQIDFLPYDLWDSEARAYSVQEEPDGKVDLLIFIFRSIANPNFLPFSGVSDLGFAGYHFLDGGTELYVYGGSGAYNDAGSSGLTICERPGHSIVISPDFAFLNTIHELGHKFFGEGHTNELYGGLGVMSNGGQGHALSSFERHLAGYLHYRELIPGMDTVVTLRDYVTENDAVLLPIPQLDRAYYSFEFRGKKSAWDTAPVEGLYIYRVYDSWSKSQKRVQVISAEGAFEWKLDSSSGKVHPIRSAPLSGYNRLQRIELDGRGYWAEGWWGIPEIAFRENRTEMAVLKNPSSDFMWGPDTIHTGLYIRLLELTDSTATVRISYREPVILSAESPAPSTASLGLPYPHPVTGISGTARIPISLSNPGRVRLVLLDAFGRKAADVADIFLHGGAHIIPLPVRNLSAGTYLLVMETTTARHTRLLQVTH
ncbi:MAG: hypothetical protein JXA28_06370 [Bacteroidetes bacterium]|nr:hypothetical protein [Bacteroidota bacterium]